MNPVASTAQSPAKANGSNGSGHGARRRVLLVEDEPAVSTVISRALDDQGFDVTPCRTLREARAAVARHAIDLALIDLTLPDGDGLELIVELGPSFPAIAVTGQRVSDGDRILGLDVGADDYIVKPFSPGELVARVRAVLRRADGAHPGPHSLTPPLVFGELEIDLVAHEVRILGMRVPLTRMEFDVLVALATRPRRACSRDELMEWVWGIPPNTVNTATVTEHIRRLRAKLGDPVDDPVHIVTISGFGYRFDP